MELWHKIALGLGLILMTPGYLSISGGIVGVIHVSIIAAIVCALYCYYILELDKITIGIISGIFFFIYIPVNYLMPYLLFLRYY